MTDNAKIIEAIVRLAPRMDGSLSLGEDHVSIRKVQKLAEVSTNKVGPVLNRLRNEVGRSPTREALDEFVRRLNPATAPSAMTSVKEQVSSKASSTAQLKLEHPRQAGADNSLALASLTQKVDGLLRLFADKINSAQGSLTPNSPSPASEPADASDGAKGAISTLDTSVLQAEINRGRAQVGHAAEELLRDRGPLTGVQIYDGLGEELVSPFRRRQIQELLRWSEAELENITRLPDGRWCLKTEPVVVGEQRMPSERTLRTRAMFSSMAVELIRKEGRPLGAAELYDAIPEVHSEFVRAYSSHVLIDAKSAHLIKLRNGSWWLAGQPVPVSGPANGYHSRVRADFYEDLAIEFAKIIRTNGGPVATHTIRVSLSPQLAEKLRGRNMNEILHRTRKIDPRIVCLPGRLWGHQQPLEIGKVAASSVDCSGRSTRHHEQ